MIFIPLGEINFERQLEMFDWLESSIGKFSKETWFWATHDMGGTLSEGFEDYRLSIVFCKESDATAFKLRFEL